MHFNVWAMKVKAVCGAQFKNKPTRIMHNHGDCLAFGSQILPIRLIIISWCATALKTKLQATKRVRTRVASVDVLKSLQGESPHRALIAIIELHPNKQPP